jgi:IclR family acetate operon transcriptional repressor
MHTPFGLRKPVPSRERGAGGKGEDEDERFQAEAPQRLGSPGIHGALSVLEAIVSSGPLTLSELATRLQTPKSTLHRVCSVLLERGWAFRGRDGRFDLGVRAVGLGVRSAELPIVTTFHSFAAELLTSHDETVCLAVLDGDESVFLALEETSHPVRLVTFIGSRAPAFASASGRVILADRPAEVVAAEYAGRTMVTPTGRRLRGLQGLQEILARIRRQGFAEDREETAAGLYAVAVPVRNGQKVVLAALTMCVPTSRMSEERRVELIRDLVDIGRRLSESVAWLPAWNARRPEAYRMTQPAWIG